jgi:hypothetical protein
MPIANVELVMMALAAVLAAQHFPCKVWEGLPALSCTWKAWKWHSALPTPSASANSKLRGGGKPLGGAHAVIPTAAPTMDCIGKALENLVLATSNDTTVLQQLTAANLALTASVTLLMAANKKLADALAQNKGGVMPAAASAPALGKGHNKPFPGNYCWTHVHKVSQNHTSATCGHKAAGHKDNAMSANMMGGSKADKGWSSLTDSVGVPI